MAIAHTAGSASTSINDIAEVKRACRQRASVKDKPATIARTMELPCLNGNTPRKMTAEMAART
jgi:hypothetical protein